MGLMERWQNRKATSQVAGTPSNTPPPPPADPTSGDYIRNPWGCSRCYHHYERGDRCNFLRFAYRGRVIPADPERCPMVNTHLIGPPKYGIKVSFLKLDREKETTHA